jgi:hypothetical protein
MQSTKVVVNLPEIIAAVSGGLSASKICVLFGLSETRYYELVRNHSKQFESAKQMRFMAQRKKLKDLKHRQQGPKVEIPKSSKKITSDEKVVHLEKRLEREKKRNEELERLLKIAQEHLGKL